MQIFAKATTVVFIRFETGYPIEYRKRLNHWSHIFVSCRNIRTSLKLLRLFDHPISYSCDWAADSATDDFYGANIAGLVRCAGDLAISRAQKDGNGVHVDGLFID